jgi:hypothetical protein
MLTYADVCQTNSDFVKEPNQLKPPTLGHIKVKSVLKKTGVVANSNSGVTDSGVTDPLLPPLLHFAPPVKKEKRNLTSALDEDEEELDFSLQVRALLRQYLYFCT